MRSTKISLSIRPKAPKSSLNDFYDKPYSIGLRSEETDDPSEGIKTARNRSNVSCKKFKATSTVINRELMRQKFHSGQERAERIRSKFQKTTNKLPQISKQKAANIKYFSTGKIESKFKSILEEEFRASNNTENSFLAKVSPLKQHHKTEHYNSKYIAPLSKKPQQKELTKEEKFEAYNLIRSEFHELINATNRLNIRNPAARFNAYIQKGNNGILVKQILKKRWWWHLVDDPAKANLVWTQWHNRQFTSNLQCLVKLEEDIVLKSSKIRGSSSGIHKKSNAVKKLVDDDSFGELETKINFTSSSNYFKPRNQSLEIVAVKEISPIKIITVTGDHRIHNHVDGCLNLHSKTLLFSNFHDYMQRNQMDAFHYIPLTFCLTDADSPEAAQLFKKFDEISQSDSEQKNIWIVKPGENSNRGNGIKVVACRSELEREVSRRLSGKTALRRTVIVQKYLQKCFLINNRKFDIRCYLLVTTANGILKGYWYKHGYIRTSSAEYSLDNVEDEMIHLTNDAVQKKGTDYGKHEDNNKVSYESFKLYLKKMNINAYKFDESYEQMKKIAYYMMGSVSSKIKRKQFTFELFGLDFMLDSEMKPLLIEANSNPCLDNKGKILGKLIHELVENVFTTAVDPIFPPPTNKKNNDPVVKDLFEANNFQLIFTEVSETSPTRLQQL